MTEIDEPSGTMVTFAYDANGQRVKKTVQTGGSNPTMSQVNDHYQNGQLASQTNLGGTLLATFTYDPSGVPESVVVGADPVNGPRYYYVYNGHGDVVALTDASGNVVASYAYDVWGNLTNSSENIPNANGWTNPYRYDGRDGARYDTETGLYWLTTRAYDPTLGRFLQRDPLGRAPLFFWSQPYVYAGNNPLVNVDPSGQRFADEDILSQATAQQQSAETRRTQQVARMMPRQPAHPPVHPQTKPNSPKPNPPCNQACQAGMQQRSQQDQAGALGGISAFLGDLRAHMSFGTFFSHFGDWLWITAQIALEVTGFVGAVAIAITTVETLAGFILALNAATAALDLLIHTIGSAVALIYGDHSQQYLNYVGGIQQMADLFMALIAAVSFLILTGGTGLELGVSGLALFGARAVVLSQALGGLIGWVADVVTAGFSHLALP